MKCKYWLCLSIGIATLIILIVIAFNTGLMIGLSDSIANDTSEKIKSFYTSSWSVYTTIFGLLGIVLGVVFPLYQNNELKENVKKLEGDMRDLEKNKDEIIKSHSVVNRLLLINKPKNLRDENQWLAYLNKVNNVDIESDLDAYLTMIENFRSCLSMLHVSPEDEVAKIIINKIEKEFTCLLSSIKNKEIVINNTINIWSLILDKSFNDVEGYVELLENSITNILGNVNSSEKDLIKRLLLPEFRELLKERPISRKYKQTFKTKNSKTGKFEDIEIDMHTDKFWDENSKEKIKNFINRLKEL